MAQMDHKLTARPDAGERDLTTGELRQWLAQLEAAGDDGSTVVYARTTWLRSRLSLAWANAPVATPQREAFDPDQQMILPAVRDGGEIDPALAGIPLAAALPVSARHAKQ